MLRFFLPLPLLVFAGFLSNFALATKTDKLSLPNYEPETSFVLHWAFMDFPPLVSVNDDGDATGELVTLMYQIIKER